MKCLWTDEEFRQLIDEFWKTLPDGEYDNFDNSDKVMVQLVMEDGSFRNAMAGDDNPYLRDLVSDFEKWLKPVLRKRKIDRLLK